MLIQKKMKLVMQMPAEYTCLHEEQIQAQSRKIERLEAHNEFKDERIDELNRKVEKIDSKLDKVLDGFSDLKTSTYHDDKDLELRLKAIETELDLQKQTAKTNHQQQQANYTKLTIIVGIISVIIVVFELYLKYGLK